MPRRWRDVARRFPDDDDVATLHAEALMDLTPWAYWQPDGKPAARTRRCSWPNWNGCWRATRSTSARSTTTSTRSSPRPNRSARKPSPTRWAHWRPAPATWCTCRHTPTSASAATTTPPWPTSPRRPPTRRSSRSAAAATASIRWATCRTTGISQACPLRLHGSRTLALQAAGQTARRADMQQLEALSFMQQYLVTPLFVQVRFGQWDAILAQAGPPAELPYPRALWHFARGMALRRWRRSREGRRGTRRRRGGRVPIGASRLPSLPHDPASDYSVKLAAEAAPTRTAELNRCSGCPPRCRSPWPARRRAWRRPGCRRRASAAAVRPAAG